MSTVCAKCHRKFKGVYSLFTYWKPEDKHYLCRRCWPAKPRGGYPDSGVSGYVLVGVIIMLILSVGLVFLHQDLQKREWLQLETSPIEELEEGELVRVEGVIDEPEGVTVLGGEEKTSAEDSYYWAWDKEARHTSTSAGSGQRAQTRSQNGSCQGEPLPWWLSLCLASWVTD